MIYELDNILVILIQRYGESCIAHNRNTSNKITIKFRYG